MLSLGTSGCGFQQYAAKPIDQTALTKKLAEKRPDDPQFTQYLINNGYAPEQLPIQQWQLDDLIYCAFFFNSSLDAARAQWLSAEAAKRTAGERKLPTLNGLYTRSNNANEEISPYAYNLSIGIPVETADKRNIRIESAAHLSEIAKLAIAQAAWKLRNDVTNLFNEYQANRELIRILTKEQRYREDIVAIYQKRIELGESANVELIKAKLQLQALNTELESKQRNHAVLLSRLGSHLGLPLAQIAQMQIKHQETPTGLTTIQALTADTLQSRALLNRLDIRAALERYAVAEMKVKLEIAKQYPDLVISPDYTYEFGDKMWSLGLSGLMTILTKNKIAIAEATQLREVEAKQFETLQNNVIGEVNVTSAKLAQALQMLENKKKIHAQQLDNVQRMEKRLSAGEIDRLELSFTKLEETMAEQNIAMSYYQLANITNELENAIQAPLVDSSITNDKIERLSATQENQR